MPTEADIGICNQYLYRRFNSSFGSAGGHSGALAKAWFFSVHSSDQAGSPNAPVGGRTVGTLGAVQPMKSMDFVFAKMFQINPADIQIFLQSTNLNPPGSMALGNDVNTGPGLANSSFEMFFDRSMEVAANSRGLNRRSHFGVPWKDIGVAKDVMDVFSVMLGAVSYNDYNKGNRTTVPLPTDYSTGVNWVDNSVGKNTSQLFDLAGAGSQIIYSNVALSFNTNLVIYGRVMNFSYKFGKFNSSLVPLTAIIAISLEIYNVNNNNVPSTAAQGVTGVVSMPTAGTGKPTTSPTPTVSRTPPPSTTSRIGAT